MANTEIPMSDVWLTDSAEHFKNSSLPPQLQNAGPELNGCSPSRPSSPACSAQPISSNHTDVSSESVMSIYWHGVSQSRFRNIASRPSSMRSERCPSEIGLDRTSSRISMGSFSAIRAEGSDGQPMDRLDVAEPLSPTLVGTAYHGPREITPKNLEGRKCSNPEKIPAGYAGIELVTRLSAGKTGFVHHEIVRLPRGWQRHVAPEGNVFYHNKDKRIFTLSNVTEPENQNWIERTYDSLNMEHVRVQLALPDDTDIVIDRAEEGYYLTSWSKQCLFWPSDVDVALVTDASRPTLSEEHLQHIMKNMFWFVEKRHVAIFPNMYAVNEECVNELKAIVSFGHAESLSSENSMWPYDREMTAQIGRFLDKVDVSKPNGFYTNAFARYMDILTHERFIYFYGESYARTRQNEGVLEECCLDTSHTRLFKLFTLLLFWQPSFYFTELQKVYADQTVHYHSWRKLVDTLKNDWEISLTPATVLLSANVGFLAIQSIDNSPGSPRRTTAQIASYISALFGLANMAVTQGLLRRHRKHLHDKAARGLEFLAEREDKQGGLEILAITVSLPTGFFGWSMVSFLVALAFIFYHDTSAVPMIVMSSIEVVLLIVVAVLFFYSGTRRRVVFQMKHSRLFIGSQWRRTSRRIWEAVKRAIRSKRSTDENGVQQLDVAIQSAAQSKLVEKYAVEVCHDRDDGTAPFCASLPSLYEKV